MIFSEDFPPYPGGIAQWAAGVASSLYKLNFNIHVITRFRDEYPLSPHTLRSLSIGTMQGKHWKQLRTWYCYRELKKRCKKGQIPDAIIATTWNIARGLVPLVRKYDIRLVCVVHGLEITRKMAQSKKKWLTKTLNSCHLVIAVSGFTKKRLLDMYPVSPEKVVVFPNGVDMMLFRPGVDTTSLRSRLNLKDHKVVLTLARVIERKGHDHVIQAMPKVMQNIPDLKYVIAGSWEESYYKRLKSLVQSLRLEDSVFFTGYVTPDEVVQFYNLCDVYIMPSRELVDRGDTEGFGITYLEANACEKPVIGGRSGGVSDAVIDGATGFLVNPDDVEEIADKLIILLSDPVLSKRFGKQGRERIRDFYTWDVIAKKIAAAIENQ